MVCESNIDYVQRTLATGILLYIRYIVLHSTIKNITVIYDKIFFNVSTELHGTQLWSLFYEKVGSYNIIVTNNEKTTRGNF